QQETGESRRRRCRIRRSHARARSYGRCPCCWWFRASFGRAAGLVARLSFPDATLDEGAVAAAAVHSGRLGRVRCDGRQQLRRRLLRQSSRRWGPQRRRRPGAQAEGEGRGDG
ncbi:unnamed protein product, partial [Ectocarpus sp. 8 AP-2014]